MSHIPLALSALLIACSTIEPPSTADSGAAPATPPSPDDVEAGYVSRGIRCVRDRDASAAAPFVPPVSDDAGIDPTKAPQVSWNGGTVTKLPVFVPITFEGDPLRAPIEDAIASMGCTSFWRAFAGDYGVGDAISGPTVHVSEVPPAHIDDSAIKTWLTARLAADATLPKPDGNTIYALFYPPPTTITYYGAKSCSGFYGYHDVAVANGRTAPYVVAPRCGDIDVMTAVMSHELSEAATDPELSGYFNVAEQDVAWELLRSSEIADMCDTPQDSHFIPTDFPFTVQRIWSNRSAFLGQNPCVPADGPVWFAAVPSLSDAVSAQVLGSQVTGRGVKLAVGSTTTIDVTLIASAPTSGWQVSAEGRGGSASNPELMLSLDRSFGQAGDVLRLTITRLAPNATFVASPFVVHSRSGTEDHPWVGMVGD